MRMLICVLALVAGPAWAGWVKVSENKDATFYIDPATIRKSSQFRRVLELQDLKKRDSDGEMSLRTLDEYDCKENRNRAVSFVTYADPMAQGKELYSSSSPDKWSAVPPGTPASVILKRVCAR